MAFRMLLFAFSVLLMTKTTFGKIDCEIGPFRTCESSKSLTEIPREVSEFNELCAETKSHLRCTKEWQDECGMDRIELYRTPELFEATYSTISEICEEGTLLNSVATANLKCLNETFDKTRCRRDAVDFVEPFVKQIRETDEFEYTFSLFCLEETHAEDCVVRAAAENCGKLVEEALLEAIHRTKSLEYACNVEDAQSILKEIPNLDLKEEKKKSMTQLLEKLVE